MNNPKKKNLSLLLAILITVTCIASLYLFSKHSPAANARLMLTPPKVHGIMLSTPRVIHPFSLTQDNGKPFTQNQLKGHWSLLFFGFTHCPKICPTTMAALNKMYKNLQKSLPKAKLPQVIMVSVDPERDTLARMHSYVKTFNANFIGLRGDEKSIKSLQRDLHVIAQKIKMPTQHGNHYEIGHSASVMIIDSAAKLRGFLSYPQKAQALVADYKVIMKAYA